MEAGGATHQTPEREIQRREEHRRTRREWRDNKLFINPSLKKRKQWKKIFFVTLSMKPNFCSLFL